MEKASKKTRIWELDALRGIFILCMVAVHIIWDLDNIFIKNFDAPAVYELALSYGAIFFIVLSGICVTLGRHSARRGAIVLGFGIVITLVFLGLVHFELGAFYPVWFGILHLLGTCMLVYPLFRRLPLWALAVCAVGFALLGFYVDGVRVDFPPFLIFGFETGVHGMSDYFPIFPNLGYFLAGAFIGRTAYAKKESLLPRFPKDNPVVRALSFCGRQSLFIYVLHQPIVYGVLWLIFG